MLFLFVFQDTVNLMVLIFVDDTPVSEKNSHHNKSMSCISSWGKKHNFGCLFLYQTPQFKHIFILICSLSAAWSSHGAFVCPGPIFTEICRRQQQKAFCEYLSEREHGVHEVLKSIKKLSINLWKIKTCKMCQKVNVLRYYML